MKNYKIYPVILTLLIAGIFPVKLSSQILLPTSINNNTILAKTDSFYYTLSTISVSSTGSLTVEKGVEVRFAGGTGISVSGSLIVNGTTDEMVKFVSVDTSSKWSYISASSANIQLNGLFVSNATRFLSASYGDVYINNCHVENTFGQTGDDCIGAHYCNSFAFTNSFLDGSLRNYKIDAIDCDEITGGIIRGNIIQNFIDDGVDFGTNSVDAIVENNYIYNCNMGISIGENTTAILKRNIIVECDAGIQSHTGSNVTAYNNTLYKNDIGVECYHGTVSNSAGNLTINSCIVSGSTNETYSLQEESIFTSFFSISDTDTLPGVSNLFGDPFMVNPDNNNFHLSDSSVCIDHGDPSLPKDSAGNNIDIGAFEYGSADTGLIPTDTTNHTFVQIKSDNDNFYIYPNPASGKIYINKLNEQVSYRIISTEGKLMLYGILYKENPLININGLSKGYYLIILYSDKILLNELLLVQ